MDGRTPSILLVEDDTELAQLVSDSLSRAGFRVEVVHDGLHALERVRAECPDAVVLDAMLPRMDGFEFLRQLRPEHDVPVLMLTALEGSADQVAGLEAGADDYVVKPVDPMVLRARLHALLRRGGATRDDGELRAGPLTLVPTRREARGPDGAIPLRDAEFDLLAYLMRNAGRVVEREELFLALRGIPYDGLDRSMDLRVSKLRSTLRERLRGDGLIRTVHGRGYLLVTDS